MNQQKAKIVDSYQAKIGLDSDPDSGQMAKNLPGVLEISVNIP
jgi:hypothetical protein